MSEPNPYEIQLVGGPKDGEIVLWPNDPPELHVLFPEWDLLQWKDYEEQQMVEEMPVRIVRYQRVGDTRIYVCKDWIK